MKTVIEMAREAGVEFTYDLTETPPKTFIECWMEELERFAELVRADEREQGQKWFHAVTAQHKQAILAEREACAKVCDEQAERSELAMEKSKRTTDHAVYRAGAQTAAWNAAEIRARSNT